MSSQIASCSSWKCFSTALLCDRHHTYITTDECDLPMALVDDVVTLVLLASAAFFVALSFGLLVRYREISQKISASSDMGHDLWQALEQRMKKQDERILDIMGRLEVVQTRMIAVAAANPPGVKEATRVLQPVSPQLAPPAPKEGSLGVTRRADAQQPESQVTVGGSQESRPNPVSVPVPAPVKVPQIIDETHLAAIRLLGEGPKSTRQITDALGKSREHTARMMKELFDGGIVSRDSSTKPFVYQLTDEGRRRLRPS